MKIKGFIHFSTDKGQELNVQNATTTLGDMYFNAQAKRWVAAQRGIEEGFDFIKSIMLSMSSTTAILAGVNDNLTVYLLNLPQAELDALTPDAQLLPIYLPGTFELDHSKIVGWASIDRTSTQSKQGIFAKRAASNVLDEWISSLAWQWDAGKATGSFNCIVVGFNVVNTESSKYNGVAVYRGLESNDFLAGESLPSGYMARPNITGITGPNEILLAGTTVGTARIKYDLVSRTGVELQPGDAAYDFPLSRADWPQLIVGDKLLYFVGADTYLREYDMVTGVHTTTALYVGYKQILFVKGDYIYISSTSNRLYAYDKTTLARVTTGDIYMTDMKLPTDFINSSNYSYNYAFANYGNSEDILVTVWDVDAKDQRAIVMQDLKTDSITKILPRVYSAVNYSINNEVYNFEYYIKDEEIYRNLQGLTATLYTGYGQHGVKMSKFSGNMLSFKTFDTPQTIASDEVAKVEYAYKYGE